MMAGQPASSRLAIFLPALHAGGAERVMLNLASELSARGHDVDLVLATAVGPYLDTVPAGIRVVDLRCRRTVTALLPLVNYLRNARPSALYAAIDHANVVAIGAAAIARTATRVIASVHGPLSIDSGANHLRAGIVMQLARWLYRRADRVVAVSEGIRRDAIATLGLAPSQVTVIHNTVLTTDPVARGRAPLDADLADLEEKPFIVTAGRLIATKDMATLLQGFSQLAGPADLQLVILGDGPERHHLENLTGELGLSDRVRFAGFRANPFAFFARARLFVMSSRREGLPTVLIEAMAAGCPIVSTDCPHGPREILDNGRYGTLVPMADPQALAVAIEAMLGQPTPAERLAERIADFDTGRLVERHLAVLLGHQEPGRSQPA